MEEMAQGPLFFAEDINVFSDYLLAAGFQSCELDHRFVKWKASSVDFIEEGMWKFVGLDDLHKEIREKISADMHANAEAHRTDGGFEFEDGVLLGVATKK